MVWHIISRASVAYLISGAIGLFLLVTAIRDHIKAEEAKHALNAENEERLARQEAAREREQITAEKERLAEMKQIVRDAVAAELKIHEANMTYIIWKELNEKHPVQR